MAEEQKNKGMLWDGVWRENDPNQIWHKQLIIDGEEVNFFLTKEVLANITDDELIEAYHKCKKSK